MKRRRPRFDWWNDALEVATLAGATSGVKHRVHYVGGPRPWQVSPAAVRLVEVPC